ncbi:MAG: hypothetical protein AAFQ61_09080, partial [Cyanobacteria bacterium J06626_23]
MPFVVRAEEALAMQEDEAQLLVALSQVTQRLYASMNGRSLGKKPDVPLADSLRVHMGRRVVYGQLADGTRRRELTPNSLKLIVDAIQRPVTPRIDPQQYQGKVPNIEIQDQGHVLFREERDGTVTVNQIQLAIEQVAPVPQPERESPNEPLPLLMPAGSERAGDVLIAAQHLLNPLGQAVSPYDAVAIGPYQIQQQGEQLTVSRGEEVILSARQGQVISENVLQSDWHAFQTVTERMRLSSIGDQHPAIAEEPLREAELPPALAVLKRATAKIVNEQTRQKLEATATDWKRQAATGIKRGTTWLMAQPEALSNQRLA